MPLIVKDYSWEETPTITGISIPLKGKLPPYIFEALLYDLVNEDTSVARIDNGLVMLTLHKQTEGLWGQLCSPVMEDKPAYRAKIEENLIKAQQREEEETKKRNEKKRENDKFVLRKAMDLDQQERDRISGIKEEEKRKATEELERWKEEQRQAALQEKAKLAEEARREREERESEIRRQKLIEKANRKNNVFDKVYDEDSVRASGKIEVKFTPRVFPTAMRESTKHLEEEWLKKQAEARRTADIEDSDLTEEEKNPMIMKEKAE
ncbi:DYX1C1 [Bugula neritina]|uniref:DYX1C1 n=1 Tax=Bugula neritina TaxID=10212 RepID=A0A7J7JXD7_BUGNE|nr:DYX1C1 [Bugula neritina]